MSKPWPPPPDLESIKQLVREADTEGLIQYCDAPADEYDGEAEALLAAISRFQTAQLTMADLQPIIETIWQKNFNLDDSALDKSRPAIISLAQEIERFFGPEAKPQVRGA
jgi:hypothetical protein